MKLDFNILNIICLVILLTIALPLFIVKSFQLHERFQRIEKSIKIKP